MAIVTALAPPSAPTDEPDVIAMYDKLTNDRSAMTDQPDAGEVQPGPVPTAFAVATVRNDAGESMVLLRVQTPMGAGFYFLEPATAVQVGNALRSNGKAGIAPKLHTPASGLVVPALRGPA